MPTQAVVGRGGGEFQIQGRRNVARSGAGDRGVGPSLVKSRIWAASGQVGAELYEGGRLLRTCWQSRGKGTIVDAEKLKAASSHFKSDMGVKDRRGCEDPQ